MQKFYRRTWNEGLTFSWWKKDLIYIQKLNLKFFRSFGLVYLLYQFKAILISFLFDLKTLNSETNTPQTITSFFPITSTFGFIDFCLWSQEANTRDIRCKYIKPRCMPNYFIFCSLLNLAEANSAGMHCTEHNNKHQAKRSGLTQLHFTTFECYTHGKNMNEFCATNTQFQRDRQNAVLSPVLSVTASKQHVSWQMPKRGWKSAKKKRDTKQEFWTALFLHVYLYQSQR